MLRYFLIALLACQLSFGSRDFDGTDDSVDCGSGASLDNLKAGGGMSISFWFYADTLTLGETYIEKEDTGDSLGWDIRIGEGVSSRLQFVHQGTTDFFKITVNGTVTTGVWTHVVFTWDGSDTAANSHFYVNGTEASYQSGGDGVSLTDDSAQPFMIGAESNETNSFDGRIAEVAVWGGGAILANEIAALANKLPPTRAVRSKTLVFWGPLGQGSPEPDWSGNANNCTVTGAVVADHPPVAPYFGYIYRDALDILAGFLSGLRYAFQS